VRKNIIRIGEEGRYTIASISMTLRGSQEEKKEQPVGSQGEGVFMVVRIGRRKV